MISQRAIATARNNTFKCHVSTRHDDVQRRIRPAQVAMKTTHVGDRSIRRNTNPIVDARQRQDLDVVHHPRDARDSPHATFGVRTCRWPDDLSVKYDVTAIDAVREIVEHTVVRKRHQLAPYAPRELRIHGALRQGNRR